MKKSPSLLFDILAESDEKKAKQRIRQSIDLERVPAASSEGGAKDGLKASSRNKSLDALLDSFSPETILRELLGDLFIHPDMLQEEELLGEGAYATVHRSSLSPPGGGPCFEVAVKRLKPEVLSEMNDLKDFLMEANLMRKLKSPNIVQVQGIGATDLSSLHDVKRSVYLVMEAMNGGNLKELVLRQMLSGKPVYELSDALGWCIDIANAMSYLHSVCKPMIIHRDLKLENALVGGGASGFAKAKLADFGLHKRAKLNAQGGLTTEVRGGSQVGSKSSPPNLYETVSLKNVGSFNDMSYYGGDAFHHPPPSRSVHGQPTLPSVAEVPSERTPVEKPRHGQSLQEQLAAADQRSKALSKHSSNHKTTVATKEEIHGSEHGGTSALEALKAAGYISDSQSPHMVAQYPQRTPLPPIQGSIDEVSAYTVKSNQSSNSNKKISAEEMAAQAFMNPLPPGMVEVPGESLHRKMMALMALDRAVVAEGPYCSRPVGPFCPVNEGLSSSAVSGGTRPLFDGEGLGSGGELLMASQSNVHLDVVSSMKVRDGSTSGGVKGQGQVRVERASFNPDGSLNNMGWKFADATQAVGSLMYMAPELFTSHSYNEKVDVFSFAIMSFELFSGRLLALRSDFMVGGQAAVEEYVDRRARGGERERMPSRWPDPLKDLISKCWEQDPGARPSFAEILVDLKAIRDSRILENVSATATGGGGGCGCIIS